MSKQKSEDLTGQRFGRLVVVELWDNGRRGARWICRCDCGGWSITSGWNLVNGRARSCGCLRAELLTRALGREQVRRARVAALVESRMADL